MIFEDQLSDLRPTFEIVFGIGAMEVEKEQLFKLEHARYLKSLLHNWHSI